MKREGRFRPTRQTGFRTRPLADGERLKRQVGLPPCEPQDQAATAVSASPFISCLISSAALTICRSG
jgi:hypothetical protein